MASRLSAIGSRPSSPFEMTTARRVQLILEFPLTRLPPAIRSKNCSVSLILTVGQSRPHGVWAPRGRVLFNLYGAVTAQTPALPVPGVPENVMIAPNGDGAAAWSSSSASLAV